VNTELDRNGTEVNNFRTAAVRRSHLVGQQVSDGRGRRTSVATSSGHRPLVLKSDTNKTMNLKPGLNLQTTEGLWKMILKKMTLPSGHRNIHK
jgi:hypothetical protein